MQGRSEVVELQRRAHGIMDDMDACVDGYFPTNIRDKRDRLEALAADLQAIGRTLEEEQGLRGRALRSLCLGRALDISDGFCEEAEAHLENAVKLDPTSVYAWNALAESYWSKKDYVCAKLCFQEALKVCQNKTTLRRLSMMLRIILNSQKGVANQEREEELEKSLRLAKDAVKLDVQDGISWYVLGNALLGQFFGLKRDGDQSGLLRQAIKAYNKADSLLGESHIPDLKFNRANIYTYLQQHDLAIADFERAHQLDASLNGHERAAQLRAFLKNCETMLDIKRNDKKIASFVQKLAVLPSNDEFRNLKPGENPKRRLVACVVSSMPDVDGLGIMYVVVDRFAHSHLVYVSKLKPPVRSGSVITISQPWLTRAETGTSNFKIVSVFDATARLLVDSKPIQQSHIHSPSVSIAHPDASEQTGGEREQ